MSGIFFFSGYCRGQSEDAKLSSAERSLAKGDYFAALQQLPGQGTNDLRYHYLLGLALEGLDSLVEAEKSWLAYLKLAGQQRTDRTYHLVLGNFCLANNFLLQGRWSEAERHLDAASPERVTDLPDTLGAKIWNSYGVLEVQRNDSRAAGLAFRKAVQSWAAAGRPERALLPRYSAARLLLWDKPETAAAELTKLLEFSVAPLDDLHPALIALSLCNAHLIVGNLSAAREALVEAEKRIRVDNDIRLFKEEGYYSAIRGLLYLRDGRGAEARALFADMKKGGEVLGQLLPAEVDYYKGLALQHAGQVEAARRLYENALNNTREEVAFFQVRLHQLIAECHLQQNSYTQALTELNHAKELLPPGELGDGALSLLSAEALLGNRDTLAARQMLGAVARICEGNQRENGNNEVCLRLAELLQKFDEYGAATTILDTLYQRIDQLNGLARARVQGARAKERWLVGNSVAAEKLSRESVKELLLYWSTFQGMEGMRQQRSYFDDIFRLGVQSALGQGKPEAAVALAEVARGLDLKGEALAGLSKASARLDEKVWEVTSELQAGQNLVYYLYGVDSLFALVSSVGQPTRVVTLGTILDIDATIDNYLKLIVAPVTDLDIKRERASGFYADICSYSVKLYQQLIAPLQLREGEEMIIVPDGKIHYLSFASLLRSYPDEPLLFDTHDYLIRHHAMSYLPTLSYLRDQGIHAPSVEQVALMAFAPDYGAGSRLRPLLNNQKEVAKLEELYDGDFWYGGLARREHLFGSRGSSPILHLSMHAVPNPQWPDSSWLAFAGIETRGDSAKYFAHEVRQHFDRYPLVFLSACQTAAGTVYRGEGTLSITRAIMARGNRHVIASLWNVDDEEIGPLIASFYEALAAGENSVQALRSAQVQYLESSAPRIAYPYYWSGFMHYGVSTELTPAPRKLSVWLYLFSCLVFAGFAFAVVKWIGKKNLMNST